MVAFRAVDGGSNPSGSTVEASLAIIALRLDRRFSSMTTEDPGLELVVRHVRPEVAQGDKEVFEAKLDTITQRLSEFEQDGLIAGYNVLSGDKSIASAHRGGTGSTAFDVERFDESMEWADDHGYELPTFREAPLSTGGTDRIHFPDCLLMARKGTDVVGVFPHTEDGTVVSPEDFLQRIESGTDWEFIDSGDTLTTGDPGPHGTLKAYLKANLEEIVGREWTDVDDEYPVASEVAGQIDLFCRHRSGDRYLLIEVKPDRDRRKIDRAFGQVLRYRAQYLADSARPGLSRQDVELAIAAPGFYDFHRDAAEAADIRLIEIS